MEQKKYFLTLLAAVLLVAVGFGLVKALPYAPGETLNPTCNPGDPDCTVMATSTHLQNLSVQGAAGADNLFDVSTSAGAPVLHVTSGGNFGIGTISPSQRLSVSGNMSLTGAFYDAINSPGTAGQILTSTGTGTVWTNASSTGTNFNSFIQGGNSFGVDATLGSLDNFGLNFITNSTTKMSILADGKVGIGTTTPAQFLVVVGSTTLTSLTAGFVKSTANGELYVDSTFSQATGTFVTTVTGSGNIASSGGTTPDITFTGILPVTNGGTGAAALASTDILFGNGTSAVATSSSFTFNPSINVLTVTNASTSALTVSGNSYLASANLTGTLSVSGSTTLSSLGAGFVKSTSNGGLYVDTAAFQSAGDYITALTGDVSAAGPGSAAATLATVNTNVGSFTYGSFTVNAKGLITAASSGTAPVSAVTGSGNIASSGGLTPNITFTGILPVTNGGTGAASLTSSDVLFGNGTGVVATSSNFTFNSATNALTVTNASTSALTVSGPVFVTGQSTLAAASSTSLAVSGNSYLGPTTVTGTLSVTGSTTLSSLTAGCVNSTSGGALFVASCATGSVSGTGVNGRVARWSSASALTTGVILDNGTVAGVNATSSTISFNIQGSAGVFDPFNVASSSGTSYLTVKQNGNIGIGTTTPDSKLAVKGAGTSGVSAFRVTNGNDVAILDVTDNGIVHINTTQDNTGQVLTVVQSGITYVSPGTVALAVFEDAVTGGGSAKLLVRENNTGATALIAVENSGGGIVQFGSFSDNPVVLRTNNTDRLFIANNGNVGLATTTPAQLLSVAGNMRLTGALYDAVNSPGTAGQVLTSTVTGTAWASTSTLASSLNAFLQGGNSFGTNGTLGTLDDNPLNIITNSSTKVTILANGNVGIGTTSPIQTLHIIGKTLLQNTASSSALILDRTDGKIGSLGAAAGSITTSFDQSGIYKIESNARTNILAGLFGTGATTRLQIDGTTGNVSMGTATAAQLYVVKAGVASADVQVLKLQQDVIAGGGTYIGFTQTSTANAFSKALIGYQSTGGGFGGNGKLVFAVDPTQSDTEVSSSQAEMVIQGNGNVGIGTTTPAQTLSVAGNMRLTGVLFDSSNASGTAGQILTSTGTGTAWVASSTLASSGNAFLQGGNSFGATGTLGALDNFGLNFITNSSTKMTILPSGNVGIGTPTPDNGLQVATNVVIGTDAPLPSDYGYGNLVVDGRVGIGTNSIPGGDSILVVRTDLTQNGGHNIALDNTTFGAGRMTDIIFRNAGSMYAAINGGQDADANGYLSFLTGAGTPTEFMRINSVGNVGIGTTTPSEKLDVNGGIRISGTAAGGGISANNTYIDNIAGMARILAFGPDASTRGTFELYTARADGGSPITPLFINGAGNVGIGTTAPAQTLSVAGNMRLTGALYDAVNSPGTAGQILTSTGTGTAWVASSTLASSGNAFIQGGNIFGANGILGTLDNFGLNFITNSTTKMTILPNGNVGIGTTTPLSTLSVQGVTGTNIFSVASSTGSAIFSVSQTGGVAIAAGTLNSGVSALSVTGTLSDTAAPQNGLNITVTGSGSGATAVRGTNLLMGGGYTGSGQAIGLRVLNNSVGTGTGGFNGANANYGISSNTTGTTAGNNVGGAYSAIGSSSLNLGLIGSSLGPSALNVGVAGLARLGTISVGGFFGLNGGAPVFGTSAGLIADNADVAADIFKARDDGTDVFNIIDGGNVGIGTTTPAAKLDVNDSLIIIEKSNTPASASSPCVKGSISWDSDFIYICVATNTWKRQEMVTW